MTICNATRNTVITTDAVYARSFWHRARGLIGWTDLPAGCGLVFPHCKAIYSFGKRVLLDVLFLEERG